MLGIIWQNLVDIFTRAHYVLRLHRRDDSILLTALRKDKPWSIERMALEDDLLRAVCRQLPVQDGSLKVPLAVVTKLRKALNDLPENNWFGVEISEDVGALEACKTPPDFRVQYCWSARSGCLERRISHEATYEGHACFLSGHRFWRVAGTSARDEAFLTRETISGQDILELVTRRAARWRKLRLPYRCRVRYSGTNALAVRVGQVTEDAAELLVDWKVAPACIQPIPSLHGYVVADGVVMPGLPPQVLFEEPPDQHSTCRVLSQRVPEFLEDVWPSLKPFCKGPTDELLHIHRTVSKPDRLVIELQSRPERGIGSPVAAPVLVCEGHRVPAEELSRQIEAGTRYVRMPTGWLSVGSLRGVRVGPLGRATDGTELKPVALSPAEVLMRGSHRAEGPWDAIEPSGFGLPKDGATPEDAARSHIEWQLQWAIPGGIAGPADKHARVFQQALAALVKREPEVRILIVGSKKALGSLGPEWERMASQRFEGKASDPEFSGRGGSVFLAASGAMESVPALQRAKWDLICLLGADDLVKSSRSRLHEALSRTRARLVLGLFTSDEFLRSNAKKEAMSAVFGIPSGPSTDLVWAHGLRDPRKPPLPLPNAYRLQGVRRHGEPVPADLTVQPSVPVLAGDAIVVARLVPARAGSFRLSAVAHEQAAAERFIVTAEQLAGRAGRRAPFLPFHCYWPTYKDMTEAQLRWYLYWRSQVREGRYPDTDLSYIFVHVYELLNNVGVRDAEDGLRQLTGLFRQYRDRYPKLANYLVDWTADYVVVNRLPVSPLNVYLEAAEAGCEQRAVDLPLAASIARPLRQMPIVLVDQMTDYRIRKSKFYGMGYSETVDRHLGLALEQVNEYMLKQSGQGVFDLFKPCAPQPVRRPPYQSAVYAGTTREITVARVIPYSQHPPLREFLTGIAKYTENRLRARHGYSGRLRGMVVAPAIMALLDRLIPVEGEERLPSVTPSRIVIDHDRVGALIEESDELLATLLSDVEAANRAVVAVPELRRESIPRPAGTPEGMLTDLDPVNDILKELTPREREVLQALAAVGWEASESAVAEALAGMLVEPLIDRINSLSLEFLGDLLIASEGERKIVAEDYRDELEHLLPKPKAAAATAASTGLAAEWADFRRELADYQLQALNALVRQTDPAPALQQLAAGQGLMPEMLIDSINELALSMVGDLVIMADATGPVVYQGSLESVEQMLGSAAT